MQWLEIDGGELLLEREQDVWSFVVKRPRRTLVSDLIRGGFTPRGDDMVAQMNWQVADLLKSLPGTQVCEKNLEDLQDVQADVQVFPQSQPSQIPTPLKEEDHDPNTKFTALVSQIRGLARRVSAPEPQARQTGASTTGRTPAEHREDSPEGRGAAGGTVSSGPDRRSPAIEGATEEKSSAENSVHGPGLRGTGSSQGVGLSDLATQSKGTSEAQPSPAEPIPHYQFPDRSPGRFLMVNRFAASLEAMQMLRDLSENEASPEQKNILAQYTGMGAFSAVLNRTGSKEYTTLQELSGPDLDKVRASCTTAFYTPPELCRAVWNLLQAAGFNGGKILEPAVGTGAFWGAMPPALAAASHLVGVENEPVAAHIAQKLFPRAVIYSAGFEDTYVQPGSYDAVITNVPFGKFSVYDKNYPEFSTTGIHNYFIVKGLDALKPGGIGVFLTSTYTLDARNPRMREEMAKRARLVGALRFPSDTFFGYAGTDATVDALIFVKDQPDMEQDFVNTTSVQAVSDRFQDRPDIGINTWFVKHPECVLGDIYPGGQYGTGISVASRTPFKERTWKDFEPLVEPLKLAIQVAQQRAAAPIHLGQPQVSSVRQNIKQGDKKLDAKNRERFAAFEQLKQALDICLESPSDERRELLNQQYDAFIATYGWLHKRNNELLFRSEPEWGKVAALEVPSDMGYVKAEVFERDVVQRLEIPSRVESIEDALSISTGMFGKLDFDWIVKVTGKSPEHVQTFFRETGSAFWDGEENGGQGWVIRAQYLSGNVRGKLKKAEDLARLDSRWQYNVAALQMVQPRDIPAEDIEVRMGAAWVPPATMEAFVWSLYQDDPNVKRYQSLPSQAPHSVSKSMFAYDTLLGAWQVKLPTILTYSSVEITDQISTEKLFDMVLNQRPVVIYTGTGEDRQLDLDTTLAVQEKVSFLQTKFRDFLFNTDPERTQFLVKLYNETYNNYVPPVYSGDELVLPGINRNIELRKSQKAVISRMVHEKNTLLNHKVGTGKTFALVAGSLERKRLGLCTKPLITVPNNILGQFEAEARLLYPAARILTLSKEDMKTGKRTEALGRIANNQWDLVLMSHSTFGRIKLRPEFEMDALQQEIDKLVESLEYHATNTGSSMTTKRLELRKKSLETRLRRLRDKESDDGIYFDQLGIDQLAVDEAHNFKRLALNTGTRDMGESQKAYDLYLKIQWVYQQRGSESGVFFATGTPVSNNVFEILNMQRFLQERELTRCGLNAAAWMTNFLVPKTEWEPNVAASGWKMRTRYALQNIPELMQMLRMVMDVATEKSAGIVCPEPERVNVLCEPSVLQSYIMKKLDKRVKALEQKASDPRKDNLLKIVSTGRLCALEARLVEPGFPDYLAGKTSQCAVNVKRIYDESADIRAAQLIFCDMGTPKGQNGYVYTTLKNKIVAQGVPEEEIAFIHDCKDDSSRVALFEKVRRGEVRCLIGSTPKMGEGMNVQQRLVALHHLDPPWRPSDIEQRNGRIVRYGNLNDKVKLFVYTTKGSFDLYMWNTMKYKAETFAAILQGEDLQTRTYDMAIDPTYAETAAITADNTLIRDKLTVEQELAKIKALMRQRERERQRAMSEKKHMLFRQQDYELELKALKELNPVFVDGKEWQIVDSLVEYPCVPRETMLATLNKLMRKEGLCSFAVSCANVPVKVSRAINEKNQEFWQWSLGEMNFANASKVEACLRDITTTRVSLQQSIAYCQSQCTASEALLAKTEASDYPERLAAAERRHAEIMSQIANLVNEQEEDLEAGKVSDNLSQVLQELRDDPDYDYSETHFTARISNLRVSGGDDRVYVESGRDTDDEEEEMDFIPG